MLASLGKLGSVPVTSSPTAFRKQFDSELAHWKKTVQDNDIKLAKFGIPDHVNQHPARKFLVSAFFIGVFVYLHWLMLQSWHLWPEVPSAYGWNIVLLIQPVFWLADLCLVYYLIWRIAGRPALGGAAGSTMILVMVLSYPLLVMMNGKGDLRRAVVKAAGTLPGGPTPEQRFEQGRHALEARAREVFSGAFATDRAVGTWVAAEQATGWDTHTVRLRSEGGRLLAALTLCPKPGPACNMGEAEAVPVMEGGNAKYVAAEFRDRDRRFLLLLGPGRAGNALTALSQAYQFDAAGFVRWSSVSGRVTRGPGGAAVSSLEKLHFFVLNDTGTSLAFASPDETRALQPLQ